jgi:chromosomal replication initiation ATPase DnaA
MTYGKIYAHISNSNPDTDRVIAVACEVCGCSIGDFYGRRRRREMVLARALFYWYAHKHYPVTLYKIASVTRQNHATVLHHSNRIRNFLFTKQDPEFTIINQFINKLS